MQVEVVAESNLDYRPSMKTCGWSIPICRCDMLEKTVKDFVRRLVKATDKQQPVYTLCPMTFGYGESGHPDQLVLVNGVLIGIECKRDAKNGLVDARRKPKPNEAAQKRQLSKIRAAGGKTFIVYDGNMAEFKAQFEAITGVNTRVKIPTD